VLILTPALTVMEKFPLPLFEAESVAVTVKFVVPVAVGVPVITPAEERFNPAGSSVPFASAKLKPVPDPPVAASVD
jgi:hypothetical protein